MTPVTYSFISYPSLQNNYTFSGTVTTDGVIGPLSATDVIAWTWTISNGVNSDTESGTNLDAAALVGLSASATELLVDGNIGEVVFQGPPNTYLQYGAVLNSYNAAILGGIRAWSATTTNASLGGDPWVIAQVTAPITYTFISCLALIRLRGHLPEGGYDGQNGIKEDWATRTATIHG
jgi:hypothetical protein